MIDSHIHFWHYRPSDYPWISDDMPDLRQDRLPQHTADEANAAGISGCIAVQARCDEAENAFLLDLARRHPQIQGIVGWLDLRSGSLKQRLAHWQQHESAHLIKGFRHLVQDEADPAAYWADEHFRRGVRELHRQGYAYDLLTHQRHLPAVAAFARYCDQGSLILDHLGKPDFRQPEAFDHWRQHMRQLAALPHVAVKISGLVTEYGHGATAAQLTAHVETAIELFGPQRIMWGSDWPVCRLSGHGYGDVLGHWPHFVRHLDDSDRQAAESGNAQRLYRLKAA